MRRGAPRRLARVAPLALIALVAVGGGLALAAQGDISTVAGTGAFGFNGDGIPAATAQISTPTGVTALADGGYLITDQGNSRIRRVFPSGVITTVAGGTTGFGGDNGPATSAAMNAPNGTAVLPDGSILIADSNNNRVRKVAPGGTITTVAGTGAATFGGDGAGAELAQVNFPADVATRADGSYLIADNDNNRIRQVSPSGIITTVVGTGAAAFGGDGGPADQAQLADPSAVAFTADGGYLIADTANNRIRKVAPGPTPTITTVAGDGTPGFAGDGGPATSASLNGPTEVAVTPEGGFLIADNSNRRIRRVAPDGIITTVAGDGTTGSAGDGGPATAAQLNGPVAVDVDAAGNYLIADAFNHRIRRVEGPALPPAQQQPQPQPQPQPPASPTPVANASVVATELRGRVLVRLPRAKRFVDLDAVTSLPLGTVVNATAGRIQIVAAANDKGATQTAVFYDGIFKLGQTGPKAKLTTVLTLAGDKPVCAKAKRARPSARKAKARRLWGDGKGRFQTKGQYSSATVRGTKWLVEDNCKGTLTKVAKGSVTVRDFAKRKNVIVKAGNSYLARARP